MRRRKLGASETVLPVFLWAGDQARSLNSCDCVHRNLRQIKRMKRFEYAVVYMKTEVTDVSSQGAISHHVRKVLNAMGKDGWELVSVAQDMEQIRLFLKRELADAKG
jgi:Domain of unknown function (DUF4177)